jgi:hypothetical protein
MNRQTKRSLATMLTGLIATLAALLLAEVVRQRACAGAGGTWEGVERSCAVPAGGSVPLLAGAGAYLVAVPAAVLLAVFLWRTYTFFATGAGGRRMPRE